MESYEPSLLRPLYAYFLLCSSSDGVSSSPPPSKISTPLPESFSYNSSRKIISSSMVGNSFKISSNVTYPRSLPFKRSFPIPRLCLSARFKTGAPLVSLMVPAALIARDDLFFFFTRTVGIFASFILRPFNFLTNFFATTFFLAVALAFLFFFIFLFFILIFYFVYLLCNEVVIFFVFLNFQITTGLFCSLKFISYFITFFFQIFFFKSKKQFFNISP